MASLVCSFIMYACSQMRNFEKQSFFCILTERIRSREGQIYENKVGEFCKSVTGPGTKEWPQKQEEMKAQENQRLFISVDYLSRHACAT